METENSLTRATVEVALAAAMEDGRTMATEAVLLRFEGTVMPQLNDSK